MSTYTVTCPLTGWVRYVGHSNNFEKRKRQHERGNIFSILGFWEKEILKIGLKVIVEEIDEGQFEYYWIEQMLTWGMPLLNSTKGFPLKWKCKYLLFRDKCEVGCPRHGHFVKKQTKLEKKEIAQKIVHDSIEEKMLSSQYSKYLSEAIVLKFETDKNKK